jgi:hypothetical protein
MDHIAWQVFDLFEPQSMVVIEHHAHRCCCAVCATQTRVFFPKRSPRRSEIRLQKGDSAI